LASTRKVGTIVTDQTTTLQIGTMRERIDEIDQAIIDLWRERADLSRQIGKARIAAGGTRLALSREQQIVDRFRKGIGNDGIPLALLVLRAGRGAL
jgi:chorismate mutase